eukprot:GFUD01000730.1.p1 GENE.GFUD01000730.1~~GFUD01000730.1.p1  ORF type:complete len:281 (+),score=118.96 GFUD01000730.1:54-896(+)
MFERLGEIYDNKERYNGDENDHDELPAIFWWFPKQEDFIPPPPTDETCLEKMERISSTIKLSRNEITEILYSDISPEEKIIRTMEIIREADHIKQLFKECEADPEAKKKDVGELLAKCRAGLVDYQANVNSLDISKFAMDMKNENEFMNGLQQQLVPWMDEGEKVTGVPLEKPKSFEQARETERQSVFFAKDVRKANKLLAKVEEAAKRLARYQTTAEGQIEEQRMRFKKIASVAASRVESMRDLLIRWEEMNNSVEKDALDFQPLTQFLKCYAIYFSSS